MSKSRIDRNQKPGLPIGLTTRRGLLKKGAGVAAVGMIPGIFAACGSDSSTSSSGGSTTAPEEIGGTINYLGWQGSDQKAVLKQFYSQNGIRVNSTYIASMSDIPAKFAGGGSGVDLLEYSSSGHFRLEQSGVKLLPLDLDRIPNWKNVEDFVELTGASNYSNANGEIVTVPYAWGSLGITYDSAKLSEPKSWKELRDPKYKNKLTLLDDPSTNYVLAAEILDIPPSEMSQDQLTEVSAFLKELLENAKQITPTFGDMSNLLASGEVEVAFGGWSAINAFAKESGNDNIKTNLEPEEGGGVFVEEYAIVEDSSQDDTLYAILNHVIDPKVNAAAAAALFEAPAAKGAQKYQPKEVVELSVPESDYASYFETSAVALDPPAVSSEFVTFGEVTEAWTQIKGEV